MRRNGYTDFAIPMKLLRDALAEQIRADKRMPHDQLVRFGVEKVLNAGLFDEYADEFKGYIVTNALNMAMDDVRVSGMDPVTGAKPKARSQPKPISAKQVEAEKTQAAKAATERLADLAPLLFMKLPTPFKHANGNHKTLGELTGKEGRKLTGWMGKVFANVPDNKRLIDVRSEAALRELWAKL